MAAPSGTVPTSSSPNRRPGSPGSSPPAPKPTSSASRSIYALLDRAAAIGPEHLHAALALHHYAARSAAWALQPDTGDPIAEHVHAALRHARDGLTRSQLIDLLHRNVSARRLDQALAN